MKIAAIIVLYHPDIVRLNSNIKAYINYVDKLIVWFNSNEKLDDLQFVDNDKILYLGTGDNCYIAKPLNVALEWCVRYGYDFLLTMDQDSEWLNFSTFIQEVRNCLDDRTVIYAPNVNAQYQLLKEFIEVESVITSGSLVNVRAAKCLGGFREDYQIYWVDGEFCHWAHLNGFTIKLLPHNHLKQYFGNPTKTLFGYTTANYSPIVYYFLIRNMLWMKREYCVNPSFKCVFYTLLYNIRGIVLGEQQKIKKLSMIFKAICDGLFKPIKKRVLC